MLLNFVLSLAIALLFTYFLIRQRSLLVTALQIPLGRTLLMIILILVTAYSPILGLLYVAGYIMIVLTTNTKSITTANTQKYTHNSKHVLSNNTSPFGKQVGSLFYPSRKIYDPSQPIDKILLQEKITAKDSCTIKYIKGTSSSVAANWPDAFAYDTVSSSN